MPALDSLEINLEAIGHALKDRYLSVPPYQRSYAWTDVQINQLHLDLADAISAKRQEYFLGTVVVGSKGGKSSEVVDGQQRLATTTILIAAIRDYFTSVKDKSRADDTERDFLVTRDRNTQELTPRLRLSADDHDFYMKRIISAPDSVDRKVKATKDSHQRIDVAAQLAAKFVQQLIKTTGKPVDLLLSWLDYIEKSTKVIWVEVPSHANAFVIFETLNDRGLDLSAADLLKNFLFSQADDRLNEVQASWARMLGTLDVISGDDVVVNFIRHHWSSVNDPARTRELFGVIKGKITSKQAAIDLANQLAESAKLYAAIVNPDDPYWTPYGDTARGHIRTLLYLRMEQNRPLLLSLLATMPQEEVKKSLKLLVSWAARYLIVGGLGGGTTEKNYSQRAGEIRAGAVATAAALASKMVGIVPDDAQFKAAFERATVSQSWLARYYLRSIERLLRKEAYPEMIPNANNDEVNLEHILPQNSGSEWPDFDADLARAYYRRIGNLTILAKPLNDAVGRSAFSAKVVEYAKSGFEMTKSLTKYKKWTKDEIDARQLELAAEAVKAWSLTP